MARLPRLTLPDLPHHVIQRGNNRQPVFIETADREMLLKQAGEQAQRFGVALHGYVLMDNHFHLLATPSAAEGLPQWMQAVGRGYVRYFNDRHGRSGTLWEGRYKSSLVQPERYLLACMAYIDLNPVRDGLVLDAGDYAWSSHAHYAGLRHDRLLTPPGLYWGLGNTPFAREAAYAEMVRAGVSPATEAFITDATLHGWAVGDPEFAESLQETTGRRTTKRRPGRPSLESKAV